MAKSAQITSGSLFIGNPVIVTVQASTVSSQATFHRVRLSVESALSSHGENAQTFLLSSPAANGESVDIDISSVLRSVAEQFTYSFPPSSAVTEYPYVAYRFSAWDEYMLEGTLEKTGIIPLSGWYTGLMGSFTDIEIYLEGLSSDVRWFSRKPAESAELVHSRSLFICPVPFVEPRSVLSSHPAYGQKTRTVDFTGKKGLQQIWLSDIYNAGTDYDKTPIPDGSDILLHTVYVCSEQESSGMYDFAFVNGRGVVETITAVSLPEETAEIEAEEFAVSHRRTFAPKDRYMMVKNSQRRVLRMSSGPLNREWQEWWMTEFLMTPQAWILLNGKWIFCSIVPEETVTVVNRSEMHLLDVQFSVKLGISGGYMQLTRQFIGTSPPELESGSTG